MFYVYDGWCVGRSVLSYNQTASKKFKIMYPQTKIILRSCNFTWLYFIKTSVDVIVDVN